MIRLAATLFLSFLLLPQQAHAVTLSRSTDSIPSPSLEKPSTVHDVPAPLAPTPGQKIWFKFKDEPLADIVNYIANNMNINVVLPGQGQDPAFFSTKISYQFPDKISITDAYEKMLSLLKMTGYLFIPQGEFYYITKADQNLNKHTYPLYVNTPPEDLPDSNQMIRYLYYFANIQVPSSASTGSSGGGGFGGPGGNALQMFLSDILKTPTYVVEPTSNGILFTDYARSLKSVMQVVKELDSYGFTDAVEILPLKHTDANTISTLFLNQLISNGSQGSSGGGSGQSGAASPLTPSTSSYFAPTTRIVADSRSNSLFIMGKKDAIRRVKEFTLKYLDVPLDSGDCILHIYPLQYLNAGSFAGILSQIVASQSGSSSAGSGNYGGSSGQSSGTANPNAGKQYFTGVIIQAESTTAPSAASASSGGTSSGTAPQAAQQGGNRLLIAASREDWLRIKQLISDLDRPQPQVAIEMLIVDFTLTGGLALGSQVRNKQGMLPTGVFAQNSILGPLQITNPSNPAFDALMSNLLQTPDSSGNNLATSEGTNAQGNNIPVPQGTFILSLQDNPITGIAWVLQALNSYTNAKILSHPFTVTLNNQPASFTDNETRLLPGAATVKKGATVTPIDPVTAALQLNITPQINGDSFINLGLNIDITEWSTGNSQIIRKIQTNANIRDGQVLVLGGLTKTTISDTYLETPGLAKIPVIGWLFKQKTKGIIKSNLAIFICPRILQSTNGYSDPYTAEKFILANASVDPDKNFTALRDPITRWFFDTKHEITNKQQVTDFINRKQFEMERTYRSKKNNTSIASATPPVPVPSVPMSAAPAAVLAATTPAQKNPPSAPLPTAKIARAPAAKKEKRESAKRQETLILSQGQTQEEAELRRLFAEYNQKDPMRELIAQTKANLL